MNQNAFLAFLSPFHQNENMKSGSYAIPEICLTVLIGLEKKKR